MLLIDLFHPNESPYFAMYTAGLNGIKLEDCIRYLSDLGVPVRGKDVRAWQDGDWKRRMKECRGSVLNPVVQERKASVKAANDRLSDFDRWPFGWTGTDRRWFPCTMDNFPMQKWGYRPDDNPPFIPELYDRPTAQAMSPCGWVGQNMYAQPFVVFDIDGRGHGDDDEQVIEFGEQFRNNTETWEDPGKPGSFHLYFATDRRIPIGHYSFAKLDIMGNETNAAVYTKNKQSNGLPRMILDDDVWECMQAYVRKRREQKGR